MLRNFAKCIPKPPSTLYITRGIIMVYTTTIPLVQLRSAAQKWLMNTTKDFSDESYAPLFAIIILYTLTGLSSVTA